MLKRAALQFDTLIVRRANVADAEGDVPNAFIGIRAPRLPAVANRSSAP
jgi:hypothetical protein